MCIETNPSPPNKLYQNLRYSKQIIYTIIQALFIIIKNSQNNAMLRGRKSNKNLPNN